MLLMKCVTFIIIIITMLPFRLYIFDLNYSFLIIVHRQNLAFFLYISIYINHIVGLFVCLFGCLFPLNLRGLKSHDHETWHVGPLCDLELQGPSGILIFGRVAPQADAA